ncbi:hypothetical protein [Vibrio sp.]|uniref:hypothetical protein n=1 Tax=Vibrio sp. TaxID=678 RepID=UPI003D117C81
MRTLCLLSCLLMLTTPAFALEGRDYTFDRNVEANVGDNGNTSIYISGQGRTQVFIHDAVMPSGRSRICETEIERCFEVRWHDELWQDDWEIDDDEWEQEDDAELY